MPDTLIIYRSTNAAGYLLARYDNTRQCRKILFGSNNATISHKAIDCPDGMLRSDTVFLSHGYGQQTGLLHLAKAKEASSKISMG
jgi:hypothetical protein